MSTVSSKRGSLHPCTCDMGAFQLPPSSLVVTVVIFVEFEKVCHPSKLYFQSSLLLSRQEKGMENGHVACARRGHPTI